MQVVDKGEDYKVKVKKWLMTIMTGDGDTRMKGESKKVNVDKCFHIFVEFVVLTLPVIFTQTYEVIADSRPSSYMLVKIPDYRMASYALQGYFENRCVSLPVHPL